MHTLLFCPETEKKYNKFIQQNNLSLQQSKQYKEYITMLLEHNALFNLTAITEISTIISDHLEDSLQIKKFIDFNSINFLADVGTGAGFPAIPLKICFPHLKILLLEVNLKKVQFLQTVIQQLNLINCEVSSLDWRTFLRKTSYPIDVFIARASLHTDELIKMFQPSCHYKDALLIYWASKRWEMGLKEQPFYHKEEIYQINNKERRYIFFKNVDNRILS